MIKPIPKSRPKPKKKGIASNGLGVGPAAAKDVVAGTPSSGGDGTDQSKDVGPLSKGASSGLSDGGQVNDKSPTAVESATTVLMSSTESSLNGFPNPNETAVRVRATPLLTLEVEGGQLNRTRRAEALLVYQTDKVYPDSPLFRGASDEWSEAYWAAQEGQEQDQEPFVMKLEGSERNHWAVFLPPAHTPESRRDQVGLVLRMVTGATIQGDPKAIQCEALLIGLWSEDVVGTARPVLEEIGRWLASVNTAQAEKFRRLRHIGLVPATISRQDQLNLRVAVQDCLPVRPYWLRDQEAVFDMELPLEPVRQVLGQARAAEGLTFKDRGNRRILQSKYTEVEHLTEDSKTKTIVRQRPADPKKVAKLNLEGVEELARLLTDLALGTKDEHGQGFTYLWTRCSSGGPRSATSTPNSLNDATAGTNAGQSAPRWRTRFK